MMPRDGSFNEPAAEASIVAAHCLNPIERIGRRLAEIGRQLGDEVLVPGRMEDALNDERDALLKQASAQQAISAADAMTQLMVAGNAAMALYDATHCDLKAARESGDNTNLVPLEFQAEMASEAVRSIFSIVRWLEATGQASRSDFGGDYHMPERCDPTLEGSSYAD